MADNRHTHRKELILNMIHHLGPISRTELIALTDYRPASVGELVAELLEERLIVESGSLSAGHGRRRILLELNREYLCAMGISFTEGSVHYIVAQPDGRILHQSHTDFSQGISRHALADRICGHVAQILSSFTEKKIVGVGICNPLYDPRSYQATTSLAANYNHFNDWIHYGLQPRLEQLTNLLVRSFSSVTLPVLAEQRFGVAKGVENFIWVELSNGIGASICCNGMAVGGAKGVAGELGHTVVSQAGGPPFCYCGKPGCVESACAYPALIGQIRSALESGVFSVLNSYHASPEEITVSDIRRALDAGDRMCMHLVKAAAKELGLAIANAVNLLNPELIVLYGFMLELGGYFLTALESTIRENVISLAENFEIRLSNSLESILPLGAVAELFSDYLQSDNYKWVYRLRPTDAEAELLQEDV